MVFISDPYIFIWNISYLMSYYMLLWWTHRLQISLMYNCHCVMYIHNNTNVYSWVIWPNIYILNYLNMITFNEQLFHLFFSFTEIADNVFAANMLSNHDRVFFNKGKGTYIYDFKISEGKHIKAAVCSGALEISVTTERQYQQCLTTWGVLHLLQDAHRC